MRQVLFLCALAIFCILSAACAVITDAPSVPDRISVGTADSLSLPLSEIAVLPEQASDEISNEAPALEPEELPVSLTENVQTNIEDNTARLIIAELAGLADEYGLSVSYISGDREYMLTVNGDRRYPSASTVKAIYCQYLYHIGANMERKICYDTDLPRTSSSGMLTEDKKGEYFTVGELIELALAYSDNMAYRLLFGSFGRWGFNAWIKELLIPGLEFTTPYEYIEVGAEDLSRGMLVILDSSYDDFRLAEQLMRGKKPLIAAGSGYDTASKYGFEGWTLGYHDTAVVFAPEPYVLTVMSNIFANSPGSETAFIRAAELVAELNRCLYGY